MRRCPFCNQPMHMVEADPHGDYEDFYLCGACQIEQMVDWELDQGAVFSETDPSEKD